MSAPAPANPRELRFTRSRQAVVMVAVGLLFIFSSAGLVAMHFQRVDDPPALAWALAPLPFAGAFFWLAWQQVRRPYLVLSRIGIEIYPFLLPARNMNLVLWQEIGATEVTPDHRLLILTLANFKDSKIFITLGPMPLHHRPLLAKAVTGVMASIQRRKDADAADAAAPEPA